MPQLVSNRDCLIPGPAQVTLNRIICANGKIIDNLIAALNSGSTLNCNSDSAMASCACVSGSEIDLELANMSKLCALSSLISQINVNVNNIVSGVSGLLYGSGSPENVRIGQKGWHYLDTDTGADYKFLGTNGTKIGWV